MSDSLEPLPTYSTTELNGQLDHHRIAEQLLMFRHVRNRIFGDILSVVGDPAWDILLELFVSRGDSATLCVGELSARLNLPPLLLKRYLSWLEKTRIIQLYETTNHVALTPTAIARIEDAIGAMLPKP
jgi:hypothetical protein